MKKPKTLTEVGLEWRRVPWINTPRGAYETKHGYKNEVEGPPCNGWQGAFTIVGERNVTIFCPFSFQTFDVTQMAAEWKGSIDKTAEFNFDYIPRLLLTNWAMHKKHGSAGADFDCAALVLTKLGIEIPVDEPNSESETEESQRSGGKPAADKLLNKARPNGKRARFLKWFLEHPEGRSVRGAMIEFDIKRAAVMSMWFAINRDMGIGYTLTGDTIAVHLPANVKPSSLFKR